MSHEPARHVRVDDAFKPAFKAQAALTQAIWKKAEELDVPRSTIELIYTRASQINGCAFCLDVHVREGLKAFVQEGLRTQEASLKLTVASAWRDTDDIFTKVELAALEVAEYVTNVGSGHFPEDDYARLRDQLGDDVLALFIWAGVCMNGWNRVHVTSRTPVGG